MSQNTSSYGKPQNVNKKINHGVLTQTDDGKTTEAVAEHLSLSKSATQPIGRAGGVGTATRCHENRPAWEESK